MKKILLSMVLLILVCSGTPWAQDGGFNDDLVALQTTGVVTGEKTDATTGD